MRARMAARWRRLRRSVRRRVAALTPRVVTEFPFEIMSFLFAVGVGVPVMVGFVSAPSLRDTVASPLVIVWGLSMLLGGLSVLVGVVRRAWPLAASGLQLLGLSLLVYSAALLMNAGPSGSWVPAVALAVLAITSMIRSSHFRRVDDLGHREVDL